jgi:hypothetical protein
VYLRPTEDEILLLAFQKVSVSALAFRGLEGWEGVTEADLLGTAIGSADAAPFTAELAAEVLADRASTWKMKLVEHLAQEVEIFMTQRGLMRKSLPPTLQPGVAHETAELASKGLIHAHRKADNRPGSPPGQLPVQPGQGRPHC